MNSGGLQSHRSVRNRDGRCVEDYPGERLIVCRNPLVGAQRARKRSELLDATDAELALIKTRVDKGALLGAAQIGMAVGPAFKR